jgi:hypothetical protein
MSNIPSIIKEAEEALKKLDGMIDKEDYSKLKTAVDELGASFRKRAYGFTLNDLYTVSELLKSKKISADDLTEGLKYFDKIDNKVSQDVEAIEILKKRILENEKLGYFTSGITLLEAKKILKHIEKSM